jgi:hypothetical protein
MPTRTPLILTLLLTAGIGAAPAHAPAAHPDHPRRARVVADLEGCRVPPPSPEPVASATCSDEGRP